MSPKHQERQRQIVESAELVLPNRVLPDSHNFILSDDDARQVGAAVSRRDMRFITDMLAEPVAQLEDHYDQIEIAELSSEWQAEIARATGIDMSLVDLLADAEGAECLDKALSYPTGEEAISLHPISHTKLLRTLLYVTHDETREGFNPREVGPRRRSTAVGRLNERVNHLLVAQANRDIGVRGIREGILDLDENVLDTFLENYSRVRLSQNVIAEALEAGRNGTIPELKRRILSELTNEQDFDELIGSHILTWEILGIDHGSANRNSRIKEHAKSRASTEKQRRAIEDNWHDERIDLLFEVAHIAKRQGRRADIYISNTFDSGAGLYLATVLSHPHAEDKNIVVADNPIFGNALYIVDELTTESDRTGRQYGWREVLGEVRQIARKRGARRRYHVGDWKSTAKAVCSYGGNAEVAARKQHEAAEKMHENSLRDVSASDTIAALERALKKTGDLLGTEY